MSSTRTVRSARIEKVRFDLPRGAVELRTITAAEEDEFEFEWPYYGISCLSGGILPSQRPYWRLPYANSWVPQSQAGILPPNCPIGLRVPRGQTQVVLCIFEPDAFGRDARFTDWPSERIGSVLNKNSALLRTTGSMLLKEMMQQQFGRQAMISSLVNLLRMDVASEEQPPRLATSNASRNRPLLPWRLRRFYGIIEAAPDIGAVNIDELAEVCRMSKKYFIAQLKASTGKSFREFIDHIRIEKVKELIAIGEETFDNISQRAGYCSASHMSASFKRHIGLTPSQYRARVRAEAIVCPRAPAQPPPKARKAHGPCLTPW